MTVVTGPVTVTLVMTEEVTIILRLRLSPTRITNETNTVHSNTDSYLPIVLSRLARLTATTTETAKAKAIK